jgi:hypothetical protein
MSMRKEKNNVHIERKNEKKRKEEKKKKKKSDVQHYAIIVLEGN